MKKKWEIKSKELPHERLVVEYVSDIKKSYSKGKIKELDKILKKAGKIGEKYEASQTALHILLNLYIDTEEIHFLKFLVKNIDDINMPEENTGITPINYAAQYGNLAILQLMMTKGNVKTDHPDNNHITPLIKAILGGHYQVAKFLLANGANPNYLTPIGFSPLMYAAECNDIEMVKILLANGADIHATTPTRMNIFTIAAEKDDLGMLKFLFEENEIDLNRLSFNLFDAILFRAACCGSHKVLKYLLPLSPIDPNIYDAKGNTPLIIAVLSSYSNSLKIIESLLTYNANIDHQNDEGVNALIYSAKNNEYDKIQMLLEYKAKTNLMTKNGTTALHSAIFNQNYDITKLLIENGADLTITLSGGSILTYAMQSKNVRIINLVLTKIKEQNIPILTPKIINDLLKQINNYVISNTNKLEISQFINQSINFEESDSSEEEITTTEEVSSRSDSENSLSSQEIDFGSQNDEIDTLKIFTDKIEESKRDNIERANFNKPSKMEDNNIQEIENEFIDLDIGFTNKLKNKEADIYEEEEDIDINFDFTDKETERRNKEYTGYSILNDWVD